MRSSFIAGLLSSAHRVGLKCESGGENRLLFTVPDQDNVLIIMDADKPNGYTLTASPFTNPRQSDYQHSYLARLFGRGALQSKVGGTDDIYYAENAEGRGAWVIRQPYEFLTDDTMPYKIATVLGNIQSLIPRILTMHRLEMLTMDFQTGIPNWTYFDRTNLVTCDYSQITGIVGAYAAVKLSGLEMIIIGTPTGYIIPVNQIITDTELELHRPDAWRALLQRLRKACPNLIEHLSIFFGRSDDDPDLVRLIDFEPTEQSPVHHIFGIEITIVDGQVNTDVTDVILRIIRIIQFMDTVTSADIMQHCRPRSVSKAQVINIANFATVTSQFS